MQKKEYYLWSDLDIGQRFPPVEYKVKEETIKKYSKAVQEENKIYLNTETARNYGFDSLVAPPTMAAIYVIEAFKGVPAPPGGVHAKQQFEFIMPAKAGDILQTSVEIVDKYVKRNKKYVVMSSETKNQDNNLIVKSIMTRIWSK
jgi:3-hydroxybutyryl-CoA dehydratase